MQEDKTGWFFSEHSVESAIPVPNSSSCR